MNSQTRFRIYTSITRLIPQKYRNHVDELLDYSGDHRTADFWIGSGSILSLLIFFTIFLAHSATLTSIDLSSPTGAFITNVDNIKTEFPYIYIFIFIFVFILVQFAIYMTIYYRAKDKTQRVEDSLPDALQLISSNLKSGMTPYQSMKLAARKEFGPLKKEIEYATTKALGVDSFARALKNMSKKIKSPLLDRAMKLFSTSMKSGGHLAQLLEDLANDIAETKTLKKELVTNTKMYSMLIFFAVIFGVPLLLSVSVFFIKIISNMQSTTSLSDVGYGMEFLAGSISITPQFLTIISIIIIVVNSILASALIGVIKEGKEKDGLKFAPAVMTGSFIVFFIAKYLISSILGI